MVTTGCKIISLISALKNIKQVNGIASEWVVGQDYDWDIDSKTLTTETKPQ